MSAPREACLLVISEDTRDLVVRAVVTFVTTRQSLHRWLLGGIGDVFEIVTSLNDAGVLTMSTLVSCVPRFSNHDLLLVVVFLWCFFMWELADVGTG